MKGELSESDQENIKELIRMQKENQKKRKEIREKALKKFQEDKTKTDNRKSEEAHSKRMEALDLAQEKTKETIPKEDDEEARLKAEKEVNSFFRNTNNKPTYLIGSTVDEKDENPDNGDFVE